MATAHNEAKKGDIAKIVLTSGDPKRCEYIASKYLKNCRLVNTVRGMTAYTGYYEDKEITVFPVGMGMASIGIYVYELFSYYDVDVIIRIGTCGTLSNRVNILDTVLLNSSYTESNYASLWDGDDSTQISYASCELNEIIQGVILDSGRNCVIGAGLCNEVFDPYLSSEVFEKMIKRLPQDMEFIATEMEAFALFYLANKFHKKASCLLTVVDSIYHPEKSVSSSDRVEKMDFMIEIALKSSLKI